MRLLALLALAAACGTTTQFAATNPSPRPLAARPAESVAVFATGLPNQPFVEVGIIGARQTTELSVDEMPEMIAEMRVEAGRQGCDGLVINGPRSSQAPMLTDSRPLDGFWGACIVFVEGPQQPAGTSAVAATSGSAP